MKKCFTFYLFLCVNFVTVGQVSFIDVIDDSGINYQGKSYGSSWGDINGDGLLDLYVSNHYNRVDDNLGGIYVLDLPHIFINLGNNTFTDTIYSINPLAGNDLHGGLIFDFDNNGTNDLLFTSGGTTRNLFFVNDESETFALTNRSQEFKIDLLNGRGRMAAALDLDQNGIVDLLFSNLPNPDRTVPTSVYTRQENGVFENANSMANLAVVGSSHGTLMDMNGDGTAELVLLTGSRLKIYDFQSGQLMQQGEITTTGNTTDYLIGDFNGDLLEDVFFTRANKGTDIGLKDSHTIQALMQNGPPVFEVTSFSFESSDSIEISIGARTPGQYSFAIHLGENYIDQVTGFQKVSFHPNQAVLQGFQEVFNDQENTHIFIGRTDGKWRFKSSNFSFRSEIGITIKAHAEITNFQPFFKGLEAGSTLDYLRINEGNFQFSPQILPVVFDSDNSRMGVVGDFDNDMDLDIYVVCSTGALNSKNYLLENVNNESWIRHDDGWGATGDGNGIGESVTVADVNNDGFLDLFVGNGMSVFFLEEAGYNLYMNQGNDNNWLGIRLVGQTATKGGYGAVVYTVAGGVKQMRTQNAGEHHKCQNDQRLHFGMAQNTVVDSVIVKWPCGTTQILLDVPVNQYLKIVEEVCIVEVPKSITAGMDSGASPNALTSSGNGFNTGIFPNPTFDWFGISTNYFGPAAIKIFDITGKKVDEFNQYFPSYGADVRHPLKLQPGVYMVQFLPEGQVEKVQKTMKLVVR